MENTKIQSAVSEQHVTESNAQLVASRVNHFQKRGYSELEALAITFNLSIFEKEEKKFREYVEYVSELTNGFETPNTVAYEKTCDFEILTEWAKFLLEYYPAYEELSEADTIDNPNIVNEERIINEHLEYFAADMRVEIETVTTDWGTTAIYVVGYSK